MYGKGEIKFKNGDSYNGEFMDGKWSGWGRMIYENIKTDLGAIDSGVYEGFWLRGKWDG